MKGCGYRSQEELDCIAPLRMDELSPAAIARESGQAACAVN